MENDIQKITLLLNTLNENYKVKLKNEQLTFHEGKEYDETLVKLKEVYWKLKSEVMNQEELEDFNKKKSRLFEIRELIPILEKKLSAEIDRIDDQYVIDTIEKITELKCELGNLEWFFMLDFEREELKEARESFHRKHD